MAKVTHNFLLFAYNLDVAEGVQLGWQFRRIEFVQLLHQAIWRTTRIPLHPLHCPGPFAPSPRVLCRHKFAIVYSSDLDHHILHAHMRVHQSQLWSQPQSMLIAADSLAQGRRAKPAAGAQSATPTLRKNMCKQSQALHISKSEFGA